MTLHQEASREVQVGTRVACEGHRGTVQYVGSVAPFEGPWLGVEWDDPSRGKHDGSHHGVRYFHTRHPTGGSFVRPGKVSLGQPITGAIAERYGAVEGEMAGVNKVNLDILKQEIKARFVQVVGFDKVNKKQSNFEDLEVVSVSYMNVNGAGPPGQLKAMCPSVTELDVTSNLLDSWDSVTEIAAQLAHLESLAVSYNVLKVPHDPVALQDHFKALKHVIAAKLGYDWSQVLHCATMWPQLEMLKVPKNNICSLQPPPGDVLSHLRVLDLEGNVIGDWQQVNKLGVISSLQELNVCEVGIKEIQFPPGDKTELFPSLWRLSLSDNHIHQWESISELNKLSCLRDLRIRKNPVLELESYETACQIVITRIANLKVLNGQQVSEERKGAEYDYLKKYALQWIKLDNSPTTPDKDANLHDFLRQHPRFPDLVAKYGLPELSELKTMPTTIAEDVIRVKLESPNYPGKVYEKDLHPRTEILALQGFAKRLFKVRKSPKLSYVSTQMPGVAHPMPLLTRSVHYYGVEAGDTVVAKW